ncbi:MAG: hypothetical protein BRD46_02470 [Bacteroidetes bacterium QS_8_68_15]|nr:MAG: hypothetical protein BRD46_02470 [Bacteroidetes bacterium QS_8_68_15]
MASSPSDRPDRDAPAPDDGGGGEGDGVDVPREERSGSADGAWRGARRLAYGVGGLLLTVVLLVTVGLLLVQTEWGSGVAKDLLLAQVNPIGEAQLQIDDIDGNWVSNLRLEGVRLVRPPTPSDEVPAAASTAPRPAPDSIRMMQIDSLQTDFRLLGLLDNRLHLDGVQVWRPDVRMAQQADGSWDLVQPFESDTAATTESAWSVRLDSVEVNRGRLDAAFHTERGADSTLRVRDFEFFARDMDFGPDSTHLDVRNLSARFAPPGQTLERRLAAGGTLDEQKLTLDRLDLNSPYSNVSGKGTLLLPGAEGGPVEEIDFQLDADPLSFRDLAGVVPSIDAEKSVRLDLRAEGTSRRLQTTFEAAFSDGATANVSGTVATDGRLRQFDPGFFTPGPAQGRINGDFDADLSGTSAEALEGTLSADVFDTRLGEYLLDRTTVDARFPGDGSIALDAQGGLRGATFAADGTLRPFDDPISYDLGGRFRNVDLGRFTGNPQQSSDLDGQLTVEGRGASLADAHLTAQLALGGSRLNQFSINEGNATARLADGTLNLRSRLRSPQGHADVSGAVRLTADPLAYDLSGTVQNLDLARFTGNSAQSSNLNGQLSVDGAGTDPTTATLDAQIALGSSRINRFQLNEGRFSVNLDGGTMGLDARVRSPQGTVDAAGSVFFREDPLRYRVTEGRVRNLDVAALAGDTTRSSLTGTFRLTGRGTNPQGDLRLDVAGLQLENSYYGPYVINSTNLDARLVGGRLDLDGQADLEGGRFDLSGATIYPFGPTPSFSVESASFANVDIGKIGQYRAGGDAQQSSDLSGSVSLEGDGFDPQTMYLDGAARLSDSRLNRQEINSAAVEFTLQDGRLAYDGTLDVPEGQTTIAGTARPFSENPTFQIEEGSTFRGVNVGALAGIEGLETNLRGEILVLEGTGFSLDELRGRARVDLSGSTINDATVESGVLDLDSEDGRTNLTATLEFADGGSADLDVEIDRTGRLSYRAAGSVDRLDLGRLVGEPEQSGQLTLSLDVEGEGTDPRTATSRGRITLTRGRFDEIEARRLLLDYTLDDGLLAVDTLALRSNVADATGGGTLALYDPDGPPRYATDFHLAANVDSLAPVRPYFSDSLRAVAVGDNQFDARLTAAPGGPLRLESDVDATGLVYNELRLSNFDGAVSATTAVRRDSTGASGVLAVLREVSSRDPFDALANAQVRGEAGYFESGSFSTRQAAVDVIYDGEQVDLEGRLKVDSRRDIELAGVLDPRPGRRRLQFDTLNVRFGEDRWKLLQDAQVTYGQQYRVSNLLLYTDDGQQIAADGVIDFDGRQSFIVSIEAFRLGAVADLFGFPQLDGVVGGTLTLSGPAAGPELSGTLDASLEVDDRRAGDIQLALDYANERLGIDATLTNDDESALTAEGYLPLDLRLSRPDSGVLAAGPSDADTLAAAAPDDTVAIGEKGSPVDIVDVRLDTLTAGDMALSAQADSFSVAWFRPFLDPEQVDDLSGYITTPEDVEIRGTPSAPLVTGLVTLTDGAFEAPALGTPYRDIRARLRFTDDRLQIEEARIKSGDGRLTARGGVDLEALTLGQLDVTLEASQFRFIATDDYRATANADLQLTGTTAAPVLRGDVDVRSADLFLDAFRSGGGEYAQADLTEGDLRDLRENFGVRVTAGDTTQPQAYQQLAIPQLDVQILRDTWLRSAANPELDVQLEGDLDLEKAAGQNLQLFGSIQVVPERSRLVQFGRRFSIENGLITFNGAPGNPSLDFEAQYSVEAYRSRGSEVTITLSMRGRPGELNFELGSNPSMAMTDILSYIATGQPASASFVGGGGGGAEGLATGVALGQITGLVEGLAGEQGFGLDIIEVEQDPQRGTVLTGGEYIYVGALGNPLFVAVSQPLTGSGASGGDVGPQTEVTLEYEVIDGFRVRLLRRRTIRLNLRYEYAY